MLGASIRTATQAATVIAHASPARVCGTGFHSSRSDPNNLCGASDLGAGRRKSDRCPFDEQSVSSSAAHSSSSCSNRAERGDHISSGGTPTSDVGSAGAHLAASIQKILQARGPNHGPKSSDETLLEKSQPAQTESCRLAKRTRDATKLIDSVGPIR